METKSVLIIIGCIIVAFAFWRFIKWTKAPRVIDKNTFKKRW